MEPETYVIAYSGARNLGQLRPLVALFSESGTIASHHEITRVVIPRNLVRSASR